MYVKSVKQSINSWASESRADDINELQKACIYANSSWEGIWMSAVNEGGSGSATKD